MKDKKNCSGCHNNFYNGNNDLGIAECWSLKDAKMKNRWAISTSTPTFQENFYQVRVPSCYQRPGTFYIDNIRQFPKNKDKPNLR